MPAEEREKNTRAARINPRLTRSRWNAVSFAGPDVGKYVEAAVEEFPTGAGPADYALCDGGDVLGVVEAKRVSLGPQNVLSQAERYSRGFDASPADYGDGFRVPFLYSTNGEVIWFHDIRHALSRSRKVAQFHTPAALREMLGRDDSAVLDRLAGLPYHGLLRDYQIEANEAVEDELRKRRRRMLLAMATGTGKTLTMVSEIHRLMKAGVARRVLFLVDRRALAAQAVRTFASFEAEPGLKFDRIYEVYSQRFQRDDLDDLPFDPRILPASYLTDPQPGHAFVYVCTIQRMTMNLFGRDRALTPDDEPPDQDAEQVDIPIHAFDVVVADECHRGYTARDISTWRNTLDYFDAVKIGLTATPAAHTVAYFDRPTYRYSYERAVREGHLVDYDAVRVNSGVRVNGVFLHQGEHVGVIDPHTGTEDFDLLEDERQYVSEEVERTVTSPDSNRKILEEVRKYTDAHEVQFGRFPKTLIFAANDLPHISHADQLVDSARDVLGRGDAFVAKITGKVDRPLQRIREFRNRPNPGVAVTVHLLSTGVDIPDLEFIVLLRQIRSRILFEQVLGRGTRKGERFPDKSHFTVFDCFDGTLLEYFRNATGITAEPPEADPKIIAQMISDIWQNVDRDHNLSRLVKRLRRIDKQMSGDARDQFTRFLPRGDLGAFAQALPTLLASAFTDTMDLLRDEQFQDLLMNYPRPPRMFVVAYEVQDNVSSEWLIRGPSGQEFRPTDYLAAFEKFVADNADTIDAIAILLARPAGWGTDALHQLREALAGAAEQFTEANLQRAYEITHRKSLADIISMVKRAAGRMSDLLTADERVTQALERVVAGRQLSADQAKWLDYIRQH
ncbi:MAG TPA: DEAD/DEAH box helicase family protein, partial [Actinomycetota bacterium]|nr:DEAD/DEAH box helicase family protein [Actinomycetota bacterium]